MAKSRGRCFLCYTHDGMDWETFDYLVAVLKDALGKRVDLLLDKDLRYGEDFSSFTELISSVDAVILLLTPQFCRKVLERAGGVYDEFSLIWRRYQDQLDMSRERDETLPRKFELIPILFSGNPDNSVPNEIKKLKYLDLTHLRVRRRPSGEFIVSRTDQINYLPKLRQVASQIIASTIIGSEEYHSLSDTYFYDYFGDLKASWNRSVEGRDILERQFVKTQCYYKIKNQQAYFAVGRKGSGKSTLIQTLPLIQHDRYFVVIDIIGDHFNLEYLYSLYSEPQFRSDTSAVVPRQKAFEFVWEASLIMASMDKLVACKPEINFLLNNSLINLIEEFLNRVKGEREQQEWYAADYFNYCFFAMVRFVRHCIKEARDDPELFFSDIGVNFRLENFLNFVFGEKTITSFYLLQKSFEHNILITLDGFDTAFDAFRLTSIQTHDEVNIRRRTYFEIDWLRSLLSFIIKAKSNSSNYFYNSLDFCAVAPMDRFMEVVKVERDSYRYWNRWFTIQWSGIELAILLRKRLEGLTEYKTDKLLNPQQRLEQILTHGQFRHIPIDVEFEFNGKNYKMPLFMYVLRHTFWRPREILIYYARILSLAENLRRWGSPVTSESLRASIKATTKFIIESEFIDELKSTILNIEDIIGSFLRRPNLLDYSSLREIVTKSVYKFATEDLTERDTVAKIRFLYDIGFLGLRLTPEQRSSLGHWHCDVFYFNEGPSIFSERFLDERDLTDFAFLIHPVFSEYLRLDTSSTELILQFDWDYLRKSEAALAIRL